MADQSSRGPEVPGERGTDDALATMNDHLARFFKHADTLLEEWKSYGESLRATIDVQVRDLERIVSTAVKDAGVAAAGSIDVQMERAVRRSLDNLRRELEALTETAQRAGQIKPRTRADTQERTRATSVHMDDREKIRPWHSGAVLLALTAANVILAVLLFSGIRSCRGESTLYPHAESLGQAVNTDAASPTPDGDPGGHMDAGGAMAPLPRAESAALCVSLGADYNQDAAKTFVGAAAKALCADEPSALAAAETLMSALPQNVGETRDSTPETKKPKDSGTTSKKKSSTKKSSKKKSSTKKSSKKKSSKKPNSKSSNKISGRTSAQAAPSP